MKICCCFLWLAGCAGKLLWVLTFWLSTLYVLLHSRMMFGVQLRIGVQLPCF